MSIIALCVQYSTVWPCVYSVVGYFPLGAK